MNFLHYQLDTGPDEEIEVALDRQANVRLLDDTNFKKYVAGMDCHFLGGLFKQSPAKIHPPNEGHWHLVIDLNGFRAPKAVRAAVRRLGKARASETNGATQDN